MKEQETKYRLVHTRYTRKKPVFKPMSWLRKFAHIAKNQGLMFDDNENDISTEDLLFLKTKNLVINAKESAAPISEDTAEAKKIEAEEKFDYEKRLDEEATSEEADAKAEEQTAEATTEGAAEEKPDLTGIDDWSWDKLRKFGKDQEIKWGSVRTRKGMKELIIKILG